MINPFHDFRAIKIDPRRIPAMRLAQDKATIQQQLLANYLQLASALPVDLFRQLSRCQQLSVYTSFLRELDLPRFVHNTLIHAASTYETFMKFLPHQDYDADDIEHFAVMAGLSDRIPRALADAAGIFLSVLVNCSHATKVTLNLERFQRSLYLVGFRLPPGKHLIIKGSLGNFSGACLSGGRLEIDGNVKNWCGAYMQKGHLSISGDSGLKTGERMVGGTIRVEGKVLGLGLGRDGGEILERGVPKR